MIHALSQQITELEDFKALEYVHNQLNTYNDSLRSPKSKKNMKDLIVFNHDGQAYMRNNETQSTNSKMLTYPW